MIKEQNRLFVTGIGTNVGKTICAAILVEYLKADYWKPIQAGDLHQSDSLTVRSLVSEDVAIHTEAYKLQMAASPHHAAAVEGSEIRLDTIVAPHTNNTLIIEGAGGLFVPLSETVNTSDLIKKLDTPIALVVRNYLGCINHSLLTLYAIKQLNIPLEYVLFNGLFDTYTKRAIYAAIPSGVKIINIPEIPFIHQQSIKTIANTILK